MLTWLVGTTAPDAQRRLHQATTVPALSRYAVFFHGESVLVRARATSIHDGVLWLEDGDDRVLWVGDATRTVDSQDQAVVETWGTFWDAGRLQPDDPHMAPYDIERVSGVLTGKPWPGRGELPVFVADGVRPATPPAAPTIHALALDPGRYAGQTITVSGRFRGRNLYGDVPQAPAQSLWDFVIRSADAAVWVTGMEPRGRDFRLSVDARADTGRWLSVTGTVRQANGLTWLEATLIETTSPQDPERATPVDVEPTQGPPPQVIFSAPVQDDTDVPLDSLVRIQFSRDMDAESFADRVRIGYAGGESAGPPMIAPFTHRYRLGNRVLEIRFAEPLAPFRTLRVELLEGIAAFDGAALNGWTLSFSLGGAPRR